MVSASLFMFIIFHTLKRKVFSPVLFSIDIHIIEGWI